MGMEKPKKSSIERVVGNISETERERIMEKKTERFNDQIFEDLAEKEREKSPEELQLIEIANDLTNEIRRQYGLENFDVPAENIHIIKKEKWPENYDSTSAFYNSELQGVVMEDHHSRLVLTARMLHEMLHFKSYNALQVTKEADPKLKAYRVGLTVVTRKGNEIYFRSLNEAVTEEMAKRLTTELSGNPLLSDEVKQTQKIMAENKHVRPAFTEDTFFAAIKKEVIKNKDESQTTKIQVTSNDFVYKQQRKMLNTLVDKIFDRNPEKFTNKEEVFGVFAKGMMTGNILPIGKLMDKTFGQGIFNKFSEMDKNRQAVDEQEKFIESL